MSEIEKEIIEEFLNLEELHSSRYNARTYLSLYQEAVQKLYTIYKQQQKEIERIKSLDIYKLIEKWETGQLIHKDKIKEIQNKYKKEIEKLESKKIWNEPVDTIKKNRYTNYYNAYEELLGGRNYE